MAWPLCGRINESKPAGWVAEDGCPANRFGDPAYADVPISSTYGPRPLVSEDQRYDFHRGLDISTPSLTPVFAIADGVVRIAGDSPSYQDPVVVLRHFRPGRSSCSSVGCYHSNYMHMTSAVVVKDDVVAKGQLIGYSGASQSGYPHLHFELRNAPDDDVYSSWQRDSIHPLGVLPYDDPSTITLTIDRVDANGASGLEVEVTVTTPTADINRVEVKLYDGSGVEIAQPGNTADALGYNVHPTWFDMTLWNRQYTHKDSTNVRWESFGVGGVRECPYAGDHGTSYSAHVHMDAQAPDDDHDGLFNGVRIATALYSQADYWLNLTFLELEGDPACIVATATPLTGDSVSVSWGDCSGSGGGGGGGKKGGKGGGNGGGGSGGGGSGGGGGKGKKNK